MVRLNRNMLPNSILLNIYLCVWLDKLLYEYCLTQGDGSYQNYSLKTTTWVVERCSRYTSIHLRALVGLVIISNCSAHGYGLFKTASNYYFNTSIHTFQKTYYVCVTKGARDGVIGWGTELQAGRSRIRFPMVSLEFFIDIILPTALRPWGWPSL